MCPGSAPDALTCRVDRAGPLLVSFSGGLRLGQVAARDQVQGMALCVHHRTSLGAPRTQLYPIFDFYAANAGIYTCGKIRERKLINHSKMKLGFDLNDFATPRYTRFDLSALFPAERRKWNRAAPSVERASPCRRRTLKEVNSRLTNPSYACDRITFWPQR